MTYTTLRELEEQMKNFITQKHLQIPKTIMDEEEKRMFSAEFRNKLTGILGFSELANHDKLFDLDIQGLYSQFKAYFNATSIRDRHINEEDIELARYYIDSLIKYCEASNVSV